MTDFDGLAAILTGGASGIGAAVAGRLTAQGARVAALDLAGDRVGDGLSGFRADVNRAGIGAQGRSPATTTQSGCASCTPTSLTWSGSAGLRCDGFAGPERQQ